jgi:hypothetical protein
MSSASVNVKNLEQIQEVDPQRSNSKLSALLLASLAGAALVIAFVLMAKRDGPPITDGTIRGMDLRQIRVDDSDFGVMSYDPAFMNTASCRSAITFIDGEHGILRYRGYPVDALAVLGRNRAESLAFENDMLGLAEGAVGGNDVGLGRGNGSGMDIASPRRGIDFVDERILRLFHSRFGFGLFQRCCGFLEGFDLVLESLGLSIDRGDHLAGFADGAHRVDRCLKFSVAGCAWRGRSVV